MEERVFEKEGKSRRGDPVERRRMSFNIPRKLSARFSLILFSWFKILRMGRRSRC